MIKLTSKDRSLLLFIITLFIALWFVFSSFTNLIFSSTFSKSDAAKIITTYKKEDGKWLNLSRNLEKKDLKNRIILLDFWTYSCVNCFSAIQEIKELEEEFGSKLLVISIHLSRFENDKDLESIKKAALKYQIHHPIINDNELKLANYFDVNATPSFVLIGPRGYVKKTYLGSEDVKYIKKDVKKLIEKYRYNLNREALPILLESDKIAKTVLNYPSKIEYVKNFSYKSYKGEVFIIANSARNNVLVTKLNGEVILQIGSTKAGFENGDFESAKFRFVSDILYNDNKIYIADLINNAIYRADLKNDKVDILIGNSQRGSVLLSETDADIFNLSSPSALEFFPDKNNIAIANSGSNQILKYNIEKNTISVLAGNGNEGSNDGLKNSLSQTSDLAAFGAKLYFSDAKSSMIRAVDKNGKVENLSDLSDAKSLRNPSGIFVASDGIYIADSLSNKIKKYNFSSKKIQDLFGDKKGDDLEIPEFDEPSDALILKDELYVVDTNNNRIVKINLKKKKASLVNIMPALELPKDGFLEYLPNLQKTENLKIKPQKVSLKIMFQDGWKLNDLGPSFLNLLEIVDENTVNLVTTFDWNMIKNGDLEMPQMKLMKKYVLQGTIYFCEDKKNALCYIKSYEENLEIADDGENEVKIEL